MSKQSIQARLDKAYADLNDVNGKISGLKSRRYELERRIEKLNKQKELAERSR